MLLERCFGLARAGATVGGEVRGGLTTFMVMAMMYGAVAAFVLYFALPAIRPLLPDSS